MPNPEQIKKSQDRRAAREGKKAQHADDAVQQEHELAALSDRLRGVLPANEDADADADAKYNEAGLRTDQIGMAAEVVRPKPKGSRADQRAAIQQAAVAQAEADLQATVNPLTERDVHDLTYYRENNIDPPLHVLNAIARRADNTIKDEARAAATAAGRAAFEALTEHRNSRSPEARHETMSKAMRDSAAAKSQVGAADPAKG